MSAHGAEEGLASKEGCAMSTTVNRLPELTLTRRGAAKRSRRSLAVKRALLACGIGSSAAYVAANVVGALRGGGYSSVNQSVSELTAIDAPSRPVALPLFVASDVLSLGFGTGVVAAAGRNRPLRVAGWLLVGVGVANMISPFTPMHTREVLASGGDTWTDPAHLTVVAGTTLQIMGAMGFAAAAFGKGFRNYSVASLVTMLVAGGLTGTQKNAVAANLPTPWNGVYERTSIGVYLLWMSVLAAVLLRASGRAQPRGKAA
jgi:Protein of unknown function (DUF998)